MPDCVLAAACNGMRGYFVTPRRLTAFLDAHAGVSVVFHNATFDLKVIQQLGRAQEPSYDVYSARAPASPLILQARSREYPPSSWPHLENSTLERTFEPTELQRPW